MTQEKTPMEGTEKLFETIDSWGIGQYLRQESESLRN